MLLSFLQFSGDKQQQKIWLKLNVLSCQSQIDGLIFNISIRNHRGFSFVMFAALASSLDLKEWN